MLSISARLTWHKRLSPPLTSVRHSALAKQGLPYNSMLTCTMTFSQQIQGILNLPSTENALFFVLAAHPRSFERQLDAIAALCPPDMAASQWDLMIEEQLRVSVRSGYQWEELVSSWTAMYCLLHELWLRQLSAGGGVHGEQLPALDDFLLEMYVLEDEPNAQLDALASYKPAGITIQDWDREVGKVRCALVVTAVNHLTYLLGQHCHVACTICVKCTILTSGNVCHLFCL